MLRLACLVFAAAVSTAVSAQTPPDSTPKAPARSVDTPRLLESRVPNFKIADTSFESVVDFLTELTGANIVVRWQRLEDLGIHRDKPLTLKLRNVRLSQILWMILNEVGGSDVKLAYMASGNIITISTQEDLDSDMVLKVYDVADLVLRIPQFRGGRIDPTQALQTSSTGGNGGNIISTTADPEPPVGGPADADAPGVGRLVRLILDTVEPDSWRDNGGKGQIQAFGNLLVVRNSPHVHALLGGYLHSAD